MDAKQVENSIIKKYRSQIWAKFVRAVENYKMIEDGDKIAVCISGGKDSILLAKLFQELQKHWKIKFDLIFLAMDPGYEKEDLNDLIMLANSLEIELDIFQNNIFNIVKEEEKSPCFVCARMRRGYLYREAKKRGCNKIALGHHFDDVIETTMISMLYGSQVQTMVPKIKSTNVEGMELLRPMYYIEEKDIIAWSKYNDLYFPKITCAFMKDKYQSSPKRLEIKELIKDLDDKNPHIRQNIFKSMENVNLNMILAYKKAGNKTDFLDIYEDKCDG